MLPLYTASAQSNHPLFLTKHLMMTPLIWSLIINLSRLVAEGSEDINGVYLHVAHTCIPTHCFKNEN
jgi:hypothetical protein